MNSSVYAAIPWGKRTQIWMKDIYQPGMLDTKDYGWPETLMPDGINYFTIGGFAIAKAVDEDHFRT